MNTYESTKIIIQSGNYEKESMLKKLDIFLTFNRITLEQYTELINLINGVEYEQHFYFRKRYNRVYKYRARCFDT